MNYTQNAHQAIFNIKDIRLRLGQILSELERRKQPILIIYRSKPKAWLYPYEEHFQTDDLFVKWEKEVLKKYQKIKANDLINLIRKDRDLRK